MIARICGNCNTAFSARQADVNRGWALFCSKTCKAQKQERRTHANHNYHFNYLGSGVSREQYLSDAEEYGGNPQYRNGHYVGFTDGCFDNTSCQNSGD